MNFFSQLCLDFITVTNGISLPILDTCFGPEISLFIVFLSITLDVGLNLFYFLSEKYPQIKKLFGVDPTFKWKVIGLVLIQFAMLYLLKDMSWPIVVVTAYLFGGVINHALMLGKKINSFNFLKNCHKWLFHL